MVLIWESLDNDGTLDTFDGKICPNMSGFQSRHNGMKHITIWVGIGCLQEKCQWYGTKCNIDTKKNLLVDVLND
jgi:hypothetical protein